MRIKVNYDSQNDDILSQNYETSQNYDKIMR